jgi:magnesium chelatase family protein
LQIEVPAVSAADLVLPAPTEGSAEVRARVIAARGRQRARFAALGAKGVRTNAECSGKLLEEVALPEEAGLALLRQASETLQLSARGFHRTLRVVRTLADLDGVERVSRVHVAEALSYRGETLRQQRAA